jgi:broad specificity phosphatase PhoE
MNTAFYLVRHRESEKNVLEIHHSRWINDFPLTETWVSETEILVEQFLWKAIDMIFTSPFKRCIQNITPLSQVRGIFPLIDERITEADVGNLDRTPWRLSWDTNRKLTDIPLWKVWESLLHCRSRVWNFLDEIKEGHKWKSIVVCSHGEPLLFAKQYFLGFDYDDANYRDTQYPAKDGYDTCIINESGELISYCSYGNAQI